MSLSTEREGGSIRLGPISPHQEVNRPKFRSRERRRGESLGSDEYLRDPVGVATLDYTQPDDGESVVQNVVPVGGTSHQ